MEAKTNRSKFLIGGLLIVAAVIYLIVSSTQASAQYFLTVDELNQKLAGGRRSRAARPARYWAIRSNTINRR